MRFLGMRLLALSVCLLFTSCASESLRQRMSQNREIADENIQSKSKAEHLRPNFNSNSIKSFSFKI